VDRLRRRGRERAFGPSGVNALRAVDVDALRAVDVDALRAVDVDALRAVDVDALRAGEGWTPSGRRGVDALRARPQLLRCKRSPLIQRSWLTPLQRSWLTPHPAKLAHPSSSEAGPPFSGAARSRAPAQPVHLSIFKQR